MGDERRAAGAATFPCRRDFLILFNRLLPACCHFLILILLGLMQVKVGWVHCCGVHTVDDNANEGRGGTRANEGRGRTRARTG